MSNYSLVYCKHSCSRGVTATLYTTANYWKKKKSYESTLRSILCRHHWTNLMLSILLSLAMPTSLVCKRSSNSVWIDPTPCFRLDHYGYHEASATRRLVYLWSTEGCIVGDAACRCIYDRGIMWTQCGHDVHGYVVGGNWGRLLSSLFIYIYIYWQLMPILNIILLYV